MKKNQLQPGRRKLSRHYRKCFLFITSLLTLSSCFTTVFGNTIYKNEFWIEENTPGYWDRLTMYFGASFLQSYDGNDAAKFTNPEVNFYTFSSDNKKLSTDCRPFANGTIIKLGFTTPYKKNYYIRANKLAVPPGMELYLRDNYTNTTVKYTSTTFRYLFTVNQDTLSQGENRFEFWCVDPTAPPPAPQPLNATMTASPVYSVTGQSSYTIYKGYGQQSVTLSAAVTGGKTGYRYSWSPATGIDSPNAATVTATPASTTTYTLTVLDANDSVKTISQTIYVINAVCGDSADKVSVCDNGITRCVYPSEVSQYMVDSNDYLGACLDVSADVINVSCNGFANGSINITASGARSPYTYSWSNNTTAEDLSGLVPGDYAVTINSADGRATTKTFTVTQPEQLSITATTVSNITCNGSNDGKINLAPAGGTAPYAYLWNDSATYQNRSGLAAGTYNVKITDNAGCTAEASYTLTQPSQLSVAATSASGITCNGGNNGQINIAATGGVTPYTYLWNDNTAYQNRTGLAAGTYSVTVTDDAGCKAVTSYTLTEPAPLTASITVSPYYTVEGHEPMTIYRGYGPQMVTLSATASGGTPGYTYNWTPASKVSNPNSSAVTANPTATTTYKVTITDTKGCSGTFSTRISVVDAECGSNRHPRVQVCYRNRNYCVTESMADYYLSRGGTLGSCNSGNKSAGEEGDAEPALEEPVSEINVYPNPSSGIFNILVPAQTEGGEIHIMDMGGRLVRQMTFSSAKITIDMTNEAKGSYIILLKSGADVHRSRITVVN